MATGWLRGTVVEVLSGDTVVVAGAAKPGAVAPTKKLTLSSLIAPKLVRSPRSWCGRATAWDSQPLHAQRLDQSDGGWRIAREGLRGAQISTSGLCYTPAARLLPALGTSTPCNPHTSLHMF
jgi:hypothetical protein